MKFNDLTQEDKFKVWFDYKLVFIFMKHIDKFIFNEMTFEEFCNHKYNENYGEADRWLSIFKDRIFSNKFNITL